MKCNTLATNPVVTSRKHTQLTHGGGSIMKLPTRAALVAVFSIVAALWASSAMASTQQVKDACPAPFGTGYTCMFQPATVTTTSHTKIVVKKTVTERLHQYEHVNNVIATINEGAPISGTGCTDPTAHANWGFGVGDAFRNTDKYHNHFTDKWQQGRMVCGWHMYKDSKGQWWVTGTKDNCRNRGIMIPVRHKIPKPTKPVVVFTTVKSFQSTYERWATSTHSTTYSCKAPFTLTYVNGKGICFIATQIPTPGPTAVCFIGTSPQYTWPSGYVAGQVGPNNQCIVVVQTNTCPNGTNANGTCVNQTNAAELNCQQAAQAYPGATVNFNSNTLTCTITQVNGNCSNIIVIQGNGSPQITQGGNCNSAPAATPPTVTNLTLIQGQGGALTGNTYQVCGDVTGISGHNLVGHFGTPKGSFSGGPFSTATGSGHFCASYTAPGEVGSDTYTLTVTDTNTGASASTSQTTNVQAHSNP